MTPLYSRALVAALGISFAAAARAEGDVYKDKTAPVEARVEDLLGRLTLDEKLSLLGGDRDFYIRPIPRLGIPEIKMADGPQGVRNYGPSTAYPSTVGLAATWDADLARQFGASVANDARARGVHIMLAPAVNITRVPQNGRNFEYLSEDPCLAGSVATQIVVGMQGAGSGRHGKAFRGQQPGDRPRHDRRPGERAGAARDLPSRIQSRRGEGPRVGGHGRLQPPERHVLQRERLAQRQGPQGRLGLQGCPHVGLGRRARNARRGQRRPRPRDALGGLHEPRHAGTPHRLGQGQPGHDRRQGAAHPEARNRKRIPRQDPGATDAQGRPEERPGGAGDRARGRRASQE